LTTYYNVADQFAGEQLFEESLRLCMRGVELAKMFDRPAHAGNFLRISARVSQRRGDLEEALRAIQESVKILDPGPEWINQGGKAGNFVLALVYKGRILGEDNGVSLGRPEEAVASLERAFQMADTFVHHDPDDHQFRGELATVGISLGGILRHGDPRRALDAYDHTLRHLAEVRNDVHLERYEVNLLAGSTYALSRLERFDEARRRLDMAFDRLKQLKFYPADTISPGSEAAETVQAFADYEDHRGNLSSAIRLYSELLTKIQTAKRGSAPGLEDAVHLSTIYRSAAALYRRARRADAATTLEARRLDLWRQWDHTLPNNEFVRRQLELPSLP